MSVNLSQLLTEARTLVTRLHDRDKVTDTILNQTHTLNDKIKCMKEYKEDVDDFVTETKHQPAKHRATIVHNLQQENRQIKVLQEENHQLKIGLEDYQAALDLIMHKYRLQVLQMVQMNKIQTITDQAVEALQNDFRGDELGKMVEFARTVDRCLKIGEKSSTEDQEELSRLQTENLTLRQLMKIAAQNDYAAAKTFVDLIREQSTNGNETPKSSDDQHTPTSETVDLDLSQRCFSVESLSQPKTTFDSQARSFDVADSSPNDKRIKSADNPKISSKSHSNFQSTNTMKFSRKSVEKLSSPVNDIKVIN